MTDIFDEFLHAAHWVLTAGGGISRLMADRWRIRHQYETGCGEGTRVLHRAGLTVVPEGHTEVVRCALSRRTI